MNIVNRIQIKILFIKFDEDIGSVSVSDNNRESRNFFPCLTNLFACFDEAIEIK